MFLIAITRNEILHNFQFGEEVKIHTWIVTIITDNFLSRWRNDSNGFSVIESPFFSSSNLDKIIFSKFNFNEKDDTFNLVRNTISGRPIYYHINFKGEFFCSTHISLLRKAGVSIEENISALPEFFVYRFVMPPNTLYKNIRHLLAGGQLQIKIIKDKCVIQSITHYVPPKHNENMKSVIESSNNLYELIYSSIKELEPFKNEMAVLLSGGIDSSIISNICKNNLQINKSYSTGYSFENPLFNTEKRYALSAAEALEMDHQYYEPTVQEYLNSFIESISFAEEPLHHFQTVLLHFLMKNKIQKNEKILLCGQGAGSVFGNNPYFYIHENANELLYRLLSTKLTLIFLKQVSKALGRGEELIDVLWKSKSTYPFSDPNNPIWSWMEYGSKNWVSRYFNVTEDEIIKERYNVIKNFSHMSMYDVWSLYSFFGDEDITLSLWGKIGEGNKKIIFFPFYDSSVLNYVFSLPWKLKLQKPGNCLRKEIARRSNIPEFIINRPKSSFGLRSRSWTKKNGIFEPLVPIAAKVFNEGIIRKMQSPESKKAMVYWNILNYSIWKRLFINNEPLEVLLEEL